MIGIRCPPSKHDLQLTRKVHLQQAGELVSRSQMLQNPGVILQELTRAYHELFVVLGKLWGSK